MTTHRKSDGFVGSNRRARVTRRATRSVSAVAAASLLLLGVPTVATASEDAGAASSEVAPIVQEWNVDGTAIDPAPKVGRARLHRSADGLNATARIRGLEPSGVYTFWWIVIQDDGTFPDDIFVAYGADAVVGRNGRAKIAMTASLGDASITGFMPDGVNEVPFSNLVDPEGAIVRIEIAYHGQAEDAGDQLPVWLGDFWTGTACPPDTPNPNQAQPHCPVYYAATFD